MTDDIHDILKAAQAMAVTVPSGTPAPEATATASTIAEAHFRAECEQRPVAVPLGRATATVYPIGMRPA